MLHDKRLYGLYLGIWKVQVVAVNNVIVGIAKESNEMYQYETRSVRAGFNSAEGSWR